MKGGGEGRRSGGNSSTKGTSGCFWRVSCVSGESRGLSRTLVGLVVVKRGFRVLLTG